MIVSMLRQVWIDRRRRLYPAAVAALVVWSAVWLTPRSYEATASLRWSGKQSRPHVAGQANLMGTAPQQELTSRTVLEAVIDDANLPFAAEFDRTPEGELTQTGRTQRDRQLDDLAASVHARTVVSTEAADVIAVSVRNRNSATAAQLANGLIDHYLVIAARQQRQQSAETEAFLNQQIQQQQDNLTALSARKAQLEQDNPALRSGEAAVLRDSMMAARAELGGIDQQSTQLKQQHEALGKWISEQPEQLEQRTRGRNPQVAQLQNQLAQLDQQLNEHRYKWGRTDEHPLVQKTLQERDAVQKKLKATPLYIDLAAQRQDNPARLEAQAKLETLDAQLKALTARRDTLGKQVEKLDAQQLTAFAGRNEYDDVTRQLDDAQQQLDDWRQKQRELMLAQSAGAIGGGAALSVMDRAQPPRSPVFPPPGAGWLLALLAAAMTVTAGALSRRKSDVGFHDLDDAEQELAMPVLGALVDANDSDDQGPQQTWWPKAA
ncbi:MAG: hypothetical protein IT445_07160 [Phycisphaeraceae bacterium]|nr:hypothetical protein [Phycisphaeraceae bacterium]